MLFETLLDSRRRCCHELEIIKKKAPIRGRHQPAFNGRCRLFAAAIFKTRFRWTDRRESSRVLFFPEAAPALHVHPHVRRDAVDPARRRVLGCSQ